MWLTMMAVAVQIAPAPAQSQILLHVESNSPTAVVYADSVRLGLASAGPFRIPADTRAVRLRPGLMQNWSIAPLMVPLAPTPRDTLRLRMDFPFHHRLDTHPFGAQVFLVNGPARTSLGTTPMVHVTSHLSPGIFAIELEGYERVRLTPGDQIWNRYEVSLVPLTEDIGSAQIWDAPKRRRSWIDYAAATLGVAAGVAAVHYKFKADRLDDRYQETGDPTLRPRIARLDDYSGLALGVMQLNLGVLAIRFALR